MADFMTYGLGILIHQQQNEEKELRETSTLKSVFDSYFTIIEIDSIQELIKYSQKQIEKMFGLGEGDSLVIINDFEGNLVRFEEIV